MRPELPQVWLNLAGAYQRLQSWSESEVTLREGLTHHPGHADMTLGLLVVARAKGQPESAIDTAEELLEGAKGAVRSDILTLIAQCYGDLEQREREIECYHRAVEVDPTNQIALRALGVDAARGGRYIEAVGYLERALAAGLIGEDVLYALGFARFRSGDAAVGTRLLLQVVTGDGAYAGRAHLELANQAYRQGDTIGTVTHGRAALERIADAAQRGFCSLIVGNSLLTLGEYDGAAAHLLDALRLGSMDREWVIWVADNLLDSRADLAADFLETAGSRISFDAELYARLAVSQLRVGGDEAAAVAMEQAVAAGVDLAAVTAAMDALRRGSDAPASG